MKNKLLEEIRHDLVSLTGLKAFDSLSETIQSNDSHVSVLISELIPLDFKELIGKIDIELEIDDSIHSDVKDNLSEWSRLITKLSKDEKDYFNKKEAYNALSEEIIKETDFKALYGKNNESIRKQHVKEELADEYGELKELEFSIDNLKRRISFLKSLIHTKTVLLEIKG
ncbi:hypothetical protein [Methanobrevibacter sp.]|uniref:hypothetical protein n=1 Tax=Methanobrevibacter sp. TaxID=66852 RepID=UPI00388F5BEC